jgi:hypothetical protein
MSLLLDQVRDQIRTFYYRPRRREHSTCDLAVPCFASFNSTESLCKAHPSRVTGRANGTGGMIRNLRRTLRYTRLSGCFCVTTRPAQNAAPSPSEAGDSGSGSRSRSLRSDRADDLAAERGGISPERHFPVESEMYLAATATTPHCGEASSGLPRPH